MTDLTVFNNNPRFKLFSRMITPIINLSPSYTRGLFRAYTNNHNQKNYTHNRNIFIKSRPLFK